jgi:predicted permease
MANEYRGIEVFGRPRRRSVAAARPRRRLGVFAFCAALVTIGATASGILTAVGGKYEAATLIAYLATGTSVVAVLCGGAALVTGRGRTLGAVAVILGILASPPILTRLLAWAAGL